MVESYIAVVTARAGTERLPGKNMLPVGGYPLAERSIIHARQAGLDVVVTTDIEDLKKIAERHGAVVVDRPAELSTPDCCHDEAVWHAVKEAGFEARHAVLLQPTSPFREGGVIRRCIERHAQEPHKMVVTGRDGYCVERQSWRGEIVVAGCVMVLPACGRRGGRDLAVVRTSMINMLEIDWEEDYIEACRVAARYLPFPSPVLPGYLKELRQLFADNGVTGSMTLVARPDGGAIDQSRPVAYLNHGLGYDGGRCDVLFLIANPDGRKKLESGSMQDSRLEEVVAAAKFVVVRDHGEVEFLFKHFPGLDQKSFVLERIPRRNVDGITTGALAQYILAHAGCDVERVGFSKPHERAAALSYPSVHYAGCGDDITILETWGKDREPKIQTA